MYSMLNTHSNHAHHAIKSSQLLKYRFLNGDIPTFQINSSSESFSILPQIGQVIYL